MKNWFTVPIGLFLTVLAVMELLIPLNRGDNARTIIAIAGLAVIIIILIKTRVFTKFNFNFKNKKQDEKDSNS